MPASEIDAAYTEGKKNLTDAAFEAELKKRNLTAADMREGVRRELVAKKLVDQEVVAKVAVTDQEVNDFFNANRAQFTVAEESYRVAQIVITPVRAPQQTNRTGNDATNPQEAAFKVRMIMERLQVGRRVLRSRDGLLRGSGQRAARGRHGTHPGVGAARRRPSRCRRRSSARRPGR